MNKLEQINHITMGVGVKVGIADNGLWTMDVTWRDYTMTDSFDTILDIVEVVYDQQCSDLTGGSDDGTSCDCEDWGDIFDKVAKLMREARDEAK